MAVHCNVCNERLMWAGENEGSFQALPGFRGAGGATAISDTCKFCGDELRKAVTAAAEAIVKSLEEAD